MPDTAVRNGVDVIIPLYKPDGDLFELLKRLNNQTVPPDNIILINTEESCWKALSEQYPEETLPANVILKHIAKEEFDHGKTRHTAASMSTAPVFVAMTQDAMPADEHLLENLLQALKTENAAVAYARQLPKEDCNVVERYTRRFNYPEESRVKTLADLDTLGIKTYFCSNVCAAYHKDIYEKQGGFIQRTIFNEDMIYAAGAVKAGYAVVYCGEAKVYHSHNYTCSQQFHRNFDLGVSQADHPEIFRGVPSEKEGGKMVKTTLKWLSANKKKRLMPGFVMQCISKYAGYRLGKAYRRLPIKWVKKMSMSPGYFERASRKEN